MLGVLDKSDIPHVEVVAERQLFQDLAMARRQGNPTLVILLVQTQRDGWKPIHASAAALATTTLVEPLQRQAHKESNGSK